MLVLVASMALVVMKDEIPLNERLRNSVLLVILKYNLSIVKRLAWKYTTQQKLKSDVDVWILEREGSVVYSHEVSYELSK